MTRLLRDAGVCNHRFSYRSWAVHAAHHLLPPPPPPPPSCSSQDSPEDILALPFSFLFCFTRVVHLQAGVKGGGGGGRSVSKLHGAGLCYSGLHQWQTLCNCQSQGSPHQYSSSA